jgi:proliferating cell nuclear antigen
MELLIKEQDKCEQFVSIFQNIKSFTDSINMTLNENNIYIQTMDGSNVSVLEVQLGSSWFDNYNVTQPFTIGINSNIFQKIISLWNKSLTINIDIQNKDSDKINISLIINDDNKNDLECSKYFEIPLIDIDNEHLTIPDTEYCVDIDVSGLKFKKLIDELFLMGDIIKIECDENIIYISTESDSGNMKIELNIDENNESYCIEENTSLSCSYRLKYIKNISTLHKLSKLTKIHITENMPMQIKYELENDSFVRFFLAPQIDD